jgi:hypothetical protein
MPQKAVAPPSRPREDELSRAQIHPLRQFRAATRLPVVVSGNETYYTKNLSLGGLFLLTPRRWPIGMMTDVTLRFDDEAHTVEVRVTHIQSDGIGLSFIDPEEGLRDALRKVLDAHVSPIERAAFGSLKRTMYRQLTKQLHVGWSINGLEYEATLADLSPDGLFLETEAAPSNDSTIYVHLPMVTLDDIQVVASEVRGCEARVIFRDSGSFGAKFVYPSAEFRMAVRALLAK